ncbi:MAG: Unknown protein [uncultured Aureispira sp.]|uniref:Uncharacterized protein n=1 Tax=uncultured Aureispira sp. TaxID=1331704 RepID=A0A6S6SQF2_9BACT|nr:MAG: Unknown protein [uncultured Aureispira sp.]
MMIKKISSYFQRIGIDYITDPNRQALSFDVKTPEGQWQCLVLVGNKTKDRTKKRHSGVGLYSTHPMKVPFTLRNQMAIFLMCLNSDRVFGNFELDPDSGDLHFKTYIDFENRSFSEKTVERNLLINISIMEQHLQKITKMIKCA